MTTVTKPALLVLLNYTDGYQLLDQDGRPLTYHHHRHTHDLAGAAELFTLDLAPAGRIIDEPHEYELGDSLRVIGELASQYDYVLSYDLPPIVSHELLCQLVSLLGLFQGQFQQRIEELQEELKFRPPKPVTAVKGDADAQPEAPA